MQILCLAPAFVVEVHLVYARNCGVEYLPYIVQDNKYAIKFAANTRSSEASALPISNSRIR